MDMFYQDILTEFTAMSREILGEKLTGIYLHGSMAMGCFNPEISDIDLLLVIEDDITDAQKLRFMQRVVQLNERAPKKGLELSIVKRQYCKPFVYPTPFELHFSPMHLKWFADDPDGYVSNMKGEDKDLAAHCMIINKYGVVLYGEAVTDVFGEVPKKDYIDSIWFDVGNATEDIDEEPMYIILNLCRVLAFLQEDLCLSKEQGGEWGLAHVAADYRVLIGEALTCYRTARQMQPDKKLSHRFAEEMLTAIRCEMDKYT